LPVVKAFISAEKDLSPGGGMTGGEKWNNTNNRFHI